MHPPVYLYGWTISRKKLLKYAKDNNLRRYVQKMVWSNGDSDSDEVDEDFEPETVTVYDRCLTIETALYALAKDVGLEIRYQCLLVSVLARGTVLVASFFALYSNYQLADAPSQDEVTTLWEHLRARVGVTKPPRWLPDDDEFRWRQRCWQ